LEVFIFANNSFLRLNIVNPSVETEFQMQICTTLSVLQHQAWNQIHSLLIMSAKNKKSEVFSYF